MRTKNLGLKGVLFILAIVASLLGFVSNGHPQSTWSFVTIPDLPSGATLKRLWTDQPGNLYVWASTNEPKAILFHWDGTSWSQVLYLPNHDVNAWRGHVFGTGPSDVFASAYDNSNNKLRMYHYNGISWDEQPLPVETIDCTRLRGIVGESGNVYAFIRICSDSKTRILNYDGNTWQVVHSVTHVSGDDKCGVMPAYISQNEIYATVCWGHSLWDGDSWTWYKDFDFCDAWDIWGMRDGGGTLHLYTSGANNFNNGVRVWQFIEDSPGSMTGSWGSKYGTVFSDPPGYGYRDAGNTYGIWGSGPDDIYVSGWRDDPDPDIGRVYHFNGTAWERITAFGDIPSASDVWGTGPDDVWVSLSDGRLLHYESANQPPVADAGDDQTVHPGDAVTLDASGSSDPDGDYPLIYAWTMTSKPTGSSASLTDANTSTPSFTADVPGDYTIELVVTDSKDLSSEADQVLVSTYNSPPVADAGKDQAIIVIGSTVHLGADPSRQSYDDDGDPITYLWTMTNKPTESTATLSGSTSATPTFQADVHGVYLIELVVSDPWISSTPDTVVVSFENVAPVADAKVDKPSVVQGETVNLDGTGSSDANGDFLYYNWSVILKPVDSTTDINNPTEAETSFLADVPGEYIVSLVVDDNIVGSDPSNVTIVAISFQDATTETLQDTTAAVNSIDIDVLKNKNMLNALTNKINAALKLVDQGQYEEALNKLENDVLLKTNGCADTGSPDKNDWIKDCESQNQVYPLIMEAIEHLMNL